MAAAGFDALADLMTIAAADTPAVAVVIVGDPGGMVDSREAVAAIGGRVVAEIGWDALVDGAPLPVVRGPIAVEAVGVDDDRLAAALPRLADHAAAHGSPIVVSLADRSIDVVAATLLGDRTQMLCEPTAAERTLALVLAAQTIGAPLLRDPRAYEGEAARLRRMNEEVARIAEVLSRLTRKEAGDRSSLEVSDRHSVFRAEPSDTVAIEPEELRRAIRGRRLRDKYFGANLFEEPAWDMMLDLFAAELERTRVSVSSLCIASAVAPTTALRWISKLSDAGLFERQPDPFDRRRAFMELSERASRAMHDYVAAMRRAGLSLA